MRQKTTRPALALEGEGEAQPVLGRGAGTQSATPRPVALAHDLMEAGGKNPQRAFKKARSNKGSPGVDGMTVNDLEPCLREARPKPRNDLLTGGYEPRPIRRADIPKPEGGTRRLGIPTVVGRPVRQALLQVLETLYGHTFSPSSYGFRPGKSAHQALEAARKHVSEGYDWVVDPDLEKFFDRVNHDILTGRLAKRIGDTRVLRLIRRYPEAGVLAEGASMTRDEGTPRGGPLSPLPANILLDGPDKMPEQRGHRFCRCADDCNIYVQSERAGQRVMASVTGFLGRKLKLKVGKAKGAVDRPANRKFLGRRVPGKTTRAFPGIHPESALRAKRQARLIAKRNRGVSPDRVLAESGRFTEGRAAYRPRCVSLLKGMDEWLRRRLRCRIWKQWKTPKNRAKQLCGLGVRRFLAYGTGSQGLWKSSDAKAMEFGVTNARLSTLGLRSLHERFVVLASTGTAVCGSARTVVWEAGKVTTRPTRLLRNRLAIGQTRWPRFSRPRSSSTSTQAEHRSRSRNSSCSWSPDRRPTSCSHARHTMLLSSAPDARGPRMPACY